MHPTDSYWAFAFPAIMTSALGCDVLFTSSSLVITNAFPEKKQALAGAVFNTVGQIGKSVGIAVSAVIATSISGQSVNQNESRPHELVLLDGYKAAWWYCFASCAAVVILSAVALRDIGKLGVKRE
jgi:nitrate/nitrite transporter NarK